MTRLNLRKEMKHKFIPGELYFMDKNMKCVSHCVSHHVSHKKAHKTYPNYNKDEFINYEAYDAFMFLDFPYISTGAVMWCCKMFYKGKVHHIDFDISHIKKMQKVNDDGNNNI